MYECYGYADHLAIDGSIPYFAQAPRGISFLANTIRRVDACHVHHSPLEERT